MNELANLLRKHENLELASQFYKKALLCIKRRYKTDYLNHESTSKVLINIATVSYLLQNIPEALKYYNHAIEILSKISGSQQVLGNPSKLLPLLSEEGKVRMSLANLFKELGDYPSANTHISAALIKLQAFGDEVEEIDN